MKRLKPKPKFKKGDLVQFTKLVPKYLVENNVRLNRPRTIKEVEYNERLQANVYYLGSNKMGESDFISGYPFRSYQLKKFKAGGKVGRPKTKRKYRRKLL